MLKTRDGRFVGEASPWGRLLAAALLAGAVVGVSALRCPGQKVGAAAPRPCFVTFLDGGTVLERGPCPGRGAGAVRPVLPAARRDGRGLLPAVGGARPARPEEVHR